MLQKTIQNRNKSGLCRCGQKLVTKTKCKDCRARDNLLSRKLRKKRLDKGLCGCGKKLVTKTKCKDCGDRDNKLTRIRSRNRKLAAIVHYGGCCCFCGETKTVFLTMDHIDGKGAKHRKEEKITTGTQTYRWLEKNNYPDGFQVACFNCNAAKAQMGEDNLRLLLME